MAHTEEFETATDAKLALDREEWEAQQADWARQSEEELAAENGWLRAAEYDPEQWELSWHEDMQAQAMQSRFDRTVYGD